MPIIGANKTSAKHFLWSQKLLVSHTSTEQLAAEEELKKLFAKED